MLQEVFAENDHCQHLTGFGGHVLLATPNMTVKMPWFLKNFLKYINQSILIYNSLLVSGVKQSVSVLISTFVKVKVARSCPTLCDPMGYTVHGILQARILKWVAFPFSRGSSQPRNQTRISFIAGRFFTN